MFHGHRLVNAEKISSPFTSQCRNKAVTWYNLASLFVQSLQHNDLRLGQSEDCF